MKIMKKTYKIIAALLLICTVLLSFGACGPKEDEPSHVDYAAELKLDMNSDTIKKEVTVRQYIDGDTTHFNFPGGIFEDNIMKGRYLAINTPESTGRIEEWGKRAADFTNEKLKAATSIIVESDDGKWNADSTGNRYMVWVWYKTAEMADYRNLNVEILQNGLAIASSSANNRYGETCVAAINQAKAEKLYVYSDEKDPQFHYGSAIEVTLKELRCAIEEFDAAKLTDKDAEMEYNLAKVAFEGVIIKDDGGSLYVEEYDAENDMYYGISVYYETAGLPGEAMSILSVGNRVRIVGTVSQFGAMWQVSGLFYDLWNENNPVNAKLISSGHQPAYKPVDAKTYANKVTVTGADDETTTSDYYAMAVYTSIAMNDLTVKEIYTTPDGQNKGAMTLTCRSADGVEVVIRTIVLKDANGNLLTARDFEGVTMDVKGLIDHFTYDGADDYQIKVYSINDITIHP